MFIDKIPPPVITKEHGSWVVLLVPIFVSAGVTGMLTLNYCFYTLSALSFFLGYVPGQALLRHYLGVRQHEEKARQLKFWASVYLIAGIVLGSYLLITGFTFLIMFGGLAAICFVGNFFVTKRYGKSIVSDLIAVAGLTLGGPGAYYVLRGRLDENAIMLYLFNFIFFSSSVFYVHMKMRASGMKKPTMTWLERVSFGKLNLAYHFAVVFLVGILIALNSTSNFALLAFAPMFVHAVSGTLNLSRKVHFKNLGFLLLGQSIVFGTLLTLMDWK